MEKQLYILFCGGTIGRSTLNVPETSALGQELLWTLPLREKARGRYTVGGLEKSLNRSGSCRWLGSGGMDFRDVATKINQSGQPRIGMGFFVDCSVYIDSTNGAYRIKRVP